MLLVGWWIDRLLKVQRLQHRLDWGAAKSCSRDCTSLHFPFQFTSPAWGYSATSSLVVQGQQLGLSVRDSQHRAAPIWAKKQFLYGELGFWFFDGWTARNFNQCLPQISTSVKKNASHSFFICWSWNRLCKQCMPAVIQYYNNIYIY